MGNPFDTELLEPRDLLDEDEDEMAAAIARGEVRSREEWMQQHGITWENSRRSVRCARCLQRTQPQVDLEVLQLLFERWEERMDNMEYLALASAIERLGGGDPRIRM